MRDYSDKRKPFTRNGLAIPLALALLLFVGTVGCENSPGQCGNGVTERKNDEECDCGMDPANLPSTCIGTNGAPRTNCTADCKGQNVNYTTLVLRFTINGFWEDGGSFDSCNDLSTDEIHVATFGPGFYDERRVPCSDLTQTFTETSELPLNPGTYSVNATLLHYGDPVGEMSTGQGLVQTGWTTDVFVDFPLESLDGYEDFTGDLLVRFSWAGADCADASPTFDREVMTLSVDASPLAGFPDERPCEDIFWTINGLPVGDFTLRMEGAGDATDLPFCHEFPIKVGIGNNKPYFLDVPLTEDGSCFQ